MKHVLIGGIAAFAIALVGAPTANATGDETFYRLLAKDFEAARVNGEEVVNRHWALLHGQGVKTCQLLDNGWDSIDVVYQLMREGSYIFDQASSISSSAEVAYCPWHLSSS